MEWLFPKMNLAAACRRDEPRHPTAQHSANILISAAPQDVSYITVQG